MKGLLYLMFCSVVLISCHQTNNIDESASESRFLTPVVQPSELEISIRGSLSEILKKEWETAGYKVDSVQLAGMEIMHISRKDYLIDERNNQEKEFNDYIKYIEKYKDSKSPIYKPEEITANILKHAAVMDYLGRMIKKSSSDNKEVYKVAYYIKVDSKVIKYNQQQTTYLDEGFKKIVTDYNILRRPK